VQQQTFYELKWEIKENIKAGLQQFHPNHSNSHQRSFYFKPAQLQATASFVAEPTGQTNRDSGTLGSACPERFTVS